MTENNAFCLLMLFTIYFGKLEGAALLLAPQFFFYCRSCVGLNPLICSEGMEPTQASHPTVWLYIFIFYCLKYTFGVS